MRMIGIGLMGFLLAGVALLLSTMNILEQGTRYVREIATGPQLVFEHRTTAVAQEVDEAVILRANPDHPVILSSFPAYQSVAFIMPVDARPTSGYLQIDATSQVLDGVEGVLRISIHNTRRGEMLLRSGEAGRSLQIPLSPMDFAGGQLVVSFSLQGTGPTAQCGPDDGVEAVVEIETTSAVYLTLDRPMKSLRDQVHSWGNLVRIAWPHWLKQDEQVRRLVLATQFQRRGLSTLFASSPSDAGLMTDELRAALPVFPKIADMQPTDDAMVLSGANAGLRRFHRQTIWRERYELGGSSDNNTPRQFELDMHLGQLIGDQHWTLTVTLNNQLMFQEHISGAETSFKALVDLPVEAQASANTLEIVATSAAARQGICDRGPELIAEILPNSRLIAGETTFSDPLSEVRVALGKVGTVNVAITGPLSAVDADAASRILDQVIPQETAFKPAGIASHITVLAPGHTFPELPKTGLIWLVMLDSGSQQVSVLKLGWNDALSSMGPALLITPNTLAMQEAEG